MRKDFENKSVDGLIEGRNAVHEALRAQRVINKVFYVKSDGDKMLSHLAHLAKEAGAVVVPCDRRKLDSMSETGARQGIIALAATHEYAEVSDILANAEKSGRPALIVVCDEISDPHNLGAIIRSAEAAGAHGVIIPKRRSAALCSARRSLFMLCFYSASPYPCPIEPGGQSLSAISAKRLADPTTLPTLTLSSAMPSGACCR